MTRLILLGGTGFLGKPLLQKLQKDYSIKFMVHDSNLKTTSEQFRGDILKPETFINELTHEDTIVNLIGQVTPNYSDLINLNITGGLNLLHSCVKQKVRRIILISTISVYGENIKRASKETDSLKPETNYGLIKMLTEKMYQHFAKTYGINITILRLAGIYGPGKRTGFIANMINSLVDRTIISRPYNNGKQQRDLLYVDDAVQGITQAIKNPRDGFNVFNISSGKRYMMKNLITLTEQISQTKIQVKYIKDRKDEKYVWANNSKAKKILKFKPNISIEEGFRLVINHVLKN